MQCEICGSDIKEKPIRINLEGTVLDVCGKCAKYGKTVDKQSPVSRKMSPVAKNIVYKKPKRDIFDSFRDEIIEDYAETIRKARESKKLSVEQLASEIMEKSTLLRKIERGELIPEERVRKKLEKTLEIKLTERVSDNEKKTTKYVKGTTLGDVAIIKKKTK